jgi:hypothetical protein
VDKGKARVERKLEKAHKGAKSLLGRGKPKDAVEGGTRPQDAAEGSSNVGAIAMGTFRTALGIAATLVPEPFKGPAEALLKVVDVIEVCITLIPVLRTSLTNCIEG